MATQHSIEKILEGHQQIPVVSFGKEDDPIAFMKYLIGIDIHCIEVTLRTPYSMQAIDALMNNRPSNFIIGAGTVLQASQIKELQKKKIDFLVSPGLTTTLLNELIDSKIPFLPGVATPKEIMFALENGIHRMKFFPANLFGGLEALKAYGKVFPAVEFCPTGGINKMNSNDYLKLDNVFAVGGSWFQKNYNNQ